MARYFLFTSLPSRREKHDRWSSLEKELSPQATQHQISSIASDYAPRRNDSISQREETEKAAMKFQFVND